MANYIHYTQEQKDRARTTDIVDLLERQGERLKRSGKEYQWRDGSEKVTIRGNLWYHQYEEVGGDAIDFVRKFYNKNYPEAMEYLLNGYGGTLTAALPIEQKEKAFNLFFVVISQKKKPFGLQVINYLTFMIPNLPSFLLYRTETQSSSIFLKTKKS